MSLVARVMQIKTTTRVAETPKMENNECWQEYGEIQTLFFVGRN
jgi:hypothetical protein